MAERVFFLCYENKMECSFSGRTAKQAAGRAFNFILTKTESRDDCSTKKISFSLIEHESMEIINFVGQRVKLPEPIKLTIPGSDKIIKYKFKREIKRLKN